MPAPLKVSGSRRLGVLGVLGVLDSLGSLGSLVSWVLAWVLAWVLGVLGGRYGSLLVLGVLESLWVLGVVGVLGGPWRSLGLGGLGATLFFHQGILYPFLVFVSLYFSVLGPLD